MTKQELENKVIELEKRIEVLEERNDIINESEYDFVPIDKSQGFFPVDTPIVYKGSGLCYAIKKYGRKR